MKKINFKKVSCKMIDGTFKDYDMAKTIGNGLYFSVTDIEKLKLAEKIYAGEEVELSDDDCKLIATLVSSNEGLLAFAKQGVLELLNK